MVADKVYTLAPIDADLLEPVSDGWVIGDLRELDWALSRLAAIRAIIAENTALADEAKQKISARLTEINRPRESEAEFFQAAIASYCEGHKAELLKGGKAKSRSIPSGKVGWMQKGGNLVIGDEAAALAWCEATDALSLVRITKSIDKVALKARCKETGEIPDGCSIAEVTDEFYAKPVDIGLSVSGSPEKKRIG